MKSIKVSLAAKGVPASTISAQGLGNTRPVAGPNTPEGRAKSHRVEIVIAAAGRQ